MLVGLLVQWLSYTRYVPVQYYKMDYRGIPVKHTSLRVGFQLSNPTSLQVGLQYRVPTEPEGLL